MPSPACSPASAPSSVTDLHLMMLPKALDVLSNGEVQWWTDRNAFAVVLCGTCACCAASNAAVVSCACRQRSCKPACILLESPVAKVQRAARCTLIETVRSAKLPSQHDWETLSWLMRALPGHECWSRTSCSSPKRRT